MKRIREKKGQSTMEYVVTFSVITLAIAAAAYVAIQPGVEKLMTKTGEKIEAEADKIVADAPVTPPTGG